MLGSTLTIDNGTCAANAAANSVHCDIGNLDVGQQSNITFSATPTAAGAFGNTAAIAMTGTDTQPANNSVTVTVTVSQGNSCSATGLRRLCISL